MNAEHEADIVVNQLKSFYNQYKTAIFTSILAFIFLTIGTMFYQWSNNRYESKAAQSFYTIISTEDPAEKVELSHTFVDEFSHSPYTSLVELILIYDDLQKGNWQGVDMRVNRIQNMHVPTFVKDQALLLQARRMLVTNQYEKTINLIEKIKNKDQSMCMLIKGMAEEKLGRHEQASESFNKANTILVKDQPDSTLKSFMAFQFGDNKSS